MSLQLDAGGTPVLLGWPQPVGGARAKRGASCGVVGGLLGVAGRLSGTVSPFRAEQGTSLETPSRARASSCVDVVWGLPRCVWAREQLPPECQLCFLLLQKCFISQVLAPGHRTQAIMCQPFKLSKRGTVSDGTKDQLFFQPSGICTKVRTEA